MANLQLHAENTKCKIKPKNRFVSLDTLEHLDHSQCLQAFQPTGTTKKSLKQKAKNTYFSKELAKNLMCLDSKLLKAYKRTYYDCCAVIVQDGKKLTSRYCGARWCNTCNRIRTAKLLNGYLKPLKELSNPYFVTLTIPNVIKADLKHSIREMLSTSTKIIRCLKYKGYAVNGIRKLECTYNSISDTYHPHFHFIVDSKFIGNELITEWLNRYPNAERHCQDLQQINITNDAGIKELFKYQTKMVSKANNDFQIFLSPLDTIFNSIKGIRTFQSFGNIKKVLEDIDNLQSELCEDLEYYEFILWRWDKSDWVNMANGNGLTNYKPSKRMMELTNEKMIT